jgi:hypothetical protein
MNKFKLLTVLVILVLNYKLPNVSTFNTQDFSCSSNSDLQMLGCKCQTDYQQSFLINTLCQDGFYKMSCSFKSPYQRIINYFDLAIFELNKLNTFCWYELHFRNVFKITRNWIDKINLAQLVKSTNSEISFKNVSNLDLVFLI